VDGALSLALDTTRCLDLDLSALGSSEPRVVLYCDDTESPQVGTRILLEYGRQLNRTGLDSIGESVVASPEGARAQAYGSVRANKPSPSSRNSASDEAASMYCHVGVG
jgi:hypothetical protein